MCKHKSGGMSKPSGVAAAQQATATLGNRTVPSCPSHSEPPHTSTSQSNSAVQNNMVLNANSKASTLTEQDASQSNHLVNYAHNQPFYVQSIHIGNKTMNNSLLPLTQEEEGDMDDSKSEDSEDEEDIVTELSPMLLTQTFSGKHPEIGYHNISSNNAVIDSECNNIMLDFLDHRQNLEISTIGSKNNFPIPSHFFRSNTHVLPQNDSIKHYNDAQRNACIESVQNDDYMNERNWLSYIAANSMTLGKKNVSVVSNNLPNFHINDTPFNEQLSPVDNSNNSFMATISSGMANTDPVPGCSGLQRRNSIHFELGAESDKDEEEFRGRSYSLTPTIKFANFELESASETEDNENIVDLMPDSEEKLHPEEEVSLSNTTVEAFSIPVSSFGKIFPISPSAAQLSLASSYGDSGAAICKICHMTSKENDPLISPCRCSGTMQYIHCGCLMRWLEISSKRSRKPASCELCQYQYHWHKKFKVRHWQFPHCTSRDKILHFMFFISMIVMIACATVTIVCFKHDKGNKINPDRTELTQSEIVTLVCGVTFFLAFFVAMYVEVKSRCTIYKLLVKFIYLNQQWYIDEYEKKESAPVAV